jgi:hypothetical protein
MRWLILLVLIPLVSAESWNEPAVALLNDYNNVSMYVPTDNHVDFGNFNCSMFTQFNYTIKGAYEKNSVVSYTGYICNNQHGPQPAVIVSCQNNCAPVWLSTFPYPNLGETESPLSGMQPYYSGCYYVTVSQIVVPYGHKKYYVVPTISGYMSNYSIRGQPCGHSGSDIVTQLFIQTGLEVQL